METEEILLIEGQHIEERDWENYILNTFMETMAKRVLIVDYFECL